LHPAAYTRVACTVAVAVAICFSDSLLAPNSDVPTSRPGSNWHSSGWQSAIWPPHHIGAWLPATEALPTVPGSSTFLNAPPNGGVALVASVCSALRQDDRPATACGDPIIGASSHQRLVQRCRKGRLRSHNARLSRGFDAAPADKLARLAKDRLRSPGHGY